METPSSTRRVTRSQTLAASANNTTANSLLSRKVEEPEKTMTTKSRPKNNKKQQDRSALIDITNDSPIVGLAMGNLETPSSAMSKKRITMSNQGRTPGSGEALLRGQVKTLLQKVEEEAELSKITLENRPVFNLEGFVNSPMISLVAPTPANTPQVSDGCFTSLTPSSLNEMMMISEVLDEKKQEVEEGIESENNVITRSLLLDFSEKSDSSECSSVATYQGGNNKLCVDDDDASIWSIQVNASSTIDEEEDDEYDNDYSSYYQDEEEDNDFGDNDDVDELCEGLSKISVNEEPAKFKGKHIRFLYNSDDEIEGEEQVRNSLSSPSPSRGVLRLKGLPTPKGKHLRFPTNEPYEEDDE